MQHLDEGTIHAWLDGELPAAEREALEAHIAECEQCAGAVAEARGFVAASSRILTALDSVPGGVLPATSTASSASRVAPPAVRRPFVASRAWMAAAAVLVLSTVTVIAIRPRGDLAQLRVAAATRDEKDVPAAQAAPSEDKSLAKTPNAGPRRLDSASVASATPAAPVSPAPSAAAAGGAGDAVPANAPAVVQSRAAVPADQPKPVDQTERLKLRLQAERQSTRVRPSAGAPAAMADAVSPSRNAAPASADRLSKEPAPAPAALAAGKSVAEKRERAASMQNALSAHGAATTGTNESPVLVSADTSVETGDTTVTTVYAVSGGTVTLIERAASRNERRSQKSSPGFSDHVMAKAQQDAHVDSITWSDSTGRTRTLRGAVSHDDLERIRAALFGATP